MQWCSRFCMCAICTGSAAALSTNLKQSPPDSPRGAGGSQQSTEAFSPIRKQAELPQTKLNHLRHHRTRTFHHSEHQLKVNNEVTTFFAMSLMMIICCGAFAALSPMLSQKNLHGWTGTGWPEALKTTFKSTWQRHNEEPNWVKDSKQTFPDSEGMKKLFRIPGTGSPASQGSDATKSNSQRNEDPAMCPDFPTIPEYQEIWKEDTQQSSQKQATGPPKNKPQTDSKLVAIPVECKIPRGLDIENLGYKRLLKKDRKFMVWLPPEIPGSPWVWSGSALPPAMVA